MGEWNEEKEEERETERKTKRTHTHTHHRMQHERRKGPANEIKQILPLILHIKYIKADNKACKAIMLKVNPTYG